jgi:hypothetical protein
MVVALHHLQLLLHRLEPIISIHLFHSMREGQRLSALKISKPVPRWRLRLSVLHIEHGWWQVGVLVVLPVVVVDVSVAVPRISHLKYEC